MEVLLAKLSSYGTGPVLIVVAALLGWVIKKLDENNKHDEERTNKDEARAERLKTAITAQMNAMEDRFEERFSTADKRIDDLANRVSCVERDYLPRDEHYKEFSGWRAEINRLSDLIINIFKEKK
ncbi:MAG: hypothetical protein A2Y38_00260 [Spirochaetes bacterium GWB1_59_5]|nr:MAG: hypothetical protein A2Y38_00260 [Spirochaetes bacterium GWB1_59_5]